VAGLAPKETIGSAIGRTAVKALTAAIIFGAALFLIPFLFLVFVAALAGAGAAGDDLPTTRSYVAGATDADINLVAVPISGLILGEDQGGGGLFSAVDVTYGYTIKEELIDLARDDSVDGVVLEVNSPGGTIFGSVAIADGVEEYRRISGGKPIVAYVSGIAASGGVYASAGADQIYADHGTLVGSIGVIFGPFTTYDGVTAIDGGILGGGVTTEGGITVEYLTAGRNKDFGNPYRPISAEERRVLQESLDQAYADFVGHVAKGRGLAASDIENDLGAMIFGEQQAVDNGLIDGIADRDSAYALAAEAAGLGTGQRWRVERLETGPPGLAELFGGRLLGTGTSTAEGGTAGGLAGELQTLCLGTGTVLAYHGDPAGLCTPTGSVAAD
jgi:protease-4